MATFSALASSIRFMHGDRATSIETLTASYVSDFTHFARANNDTNLVQAVQALTKGPKDKAIGEAMAQGRKASNLVTGYLGARTGKFSEQAEDVQATYNNAILNAGEAFKAHLETCEAFADKVVKTDTDKAKAKEDKAAKAKEVIDNAITAYVQAGDLVRKEDIKQLSDFGALALAEALAPMTMTMSHEAMQVLRNIVFMADKAEADTRAAIKVLEAATLAAEALAVVEAATLAAEALAVAPVKASKKAKATA